VTAAGEPESGRVTCGARRSLFEDTWEASRRADWIAEMFAYDVDREAVAFGEDGPSGKSTVTQSRV
jgi:hypothetical protein